MHHFIIDFSFHLFHISVPLSFLSYFITLNPT
uniref:Uncharacterized protein n=1 Tax=Phage sp. ctv3H3 TaxID=2826753 RepID=A0A8S5NBU0_9VIRU|nr:MAG TPA: hypothetical protein [Phage sp. ctv3H3]